MTPIDWVELSWAELRWAWVQPQRPKGPLNLAACIVNICNQNKYAWDAALLWPRPHSDWEMRMQLQLLGKCNHRRRHVATNVINLATVPRPLKSCIKNSNVELFMAVAWPRTQDTRSKERQNGKWQVASGKEENEKPGQEHEELLSGSTNSLARLTLRLKACNTQECGYKSNC